jgi:hypothetical protein
MKNLIICTLMLTITALLGAQIPDYNKIKNVYILDEHYANGYNTSTELLRLLEDGYYENLLYKRVKTYRDFHYVCYRNYGKFNIKNGILKIKNPTHSEFKSKHLKKYQLVRNSKVSNNIIDFVINRNEFGRATTDSCYYQPWHLHPKNRTPIFVKKHNTKPDLKELANYITKDLITEKQKATAIANFICSTLDYDIAMLKPQESYTMVFGKEKTAVCNGYADLFQTLCEEVNIKSKKVIGRTKTGFDNYSMLAENHAWNMAFLDSVWYGYDVTWMNSNSDRWTNVDPYSFSHSHYSSNELDTLFNIIDFNTFKQAAVFWPFSDDAKDVIQYLPTQGMIFTEDTFEFKLITDQEIRSINRWGNSIGIVKFAFENAGPRSVTYYGIDITDKCSKNERGINKIPLNEGMNYISLDIEYKGQISYKVFNGSKDEFLHLKIDELHTSRITGMMDAVVACIQLKDKTAYNELITDMEGALTYEEIIKSEIHEEIINSDFIYYGCLNESDSDEYDIILDLEGNKITFLKDGKYFIPVAAEEPTETLFSFDY